MSSKNPAFSLRALNPDDDQSVRELCELYSSSTQDPYPFTEVTEPQFWKGHAGQRFLSVTLRQGKQQIVGHFGLRTDHEDPRICEVLFPILQPECELTASDVAQGLMSFFAREAGRKGWQWLVSYLPASVPGVLSLGSIGFGLSETAILPLHRTSRGIHSKSMSGTDSDAATPEGSEIRSPFTYEGDVVAYIGRCPGSDIATLSSQQQPLKSEFALGTPPQRHVEILRWLTAKSGLAASDLKHSAAGDLTGDAIRSRMSRRLGARITDIVPALLTSNQQLIDKLATDRSTPHFVSVLSQSTRVDTISGLLEEMDYRFCGVVPFFAGASRYVFALDPAGLRPADSTFVRSSELLAASQLARYVEQCRGQRNAQQQGHQPAVTNSTTTAATSGSSASAGASTPPSGRRHRRPGTHAVAP